MKKISYKFINVVAFIVFVLYILLVVSCKKEETSKDNIEEETLISEIDVFSLNPEAIRYYGNMGKFIRLTTTDLNSTQVNRLKSTGSEVPDSILNPIVEEFANLDIVDAESDEPMSFFDLSTTDREVFIEQWTIACASDMTPKLEDPEIGEELEEYIQVQNDAFDEVMTELVNSEGPTLSGSGLKSIAAAMGHNELYDMISANVQLRIKEKCELYAKELLKSNPGLSTQLKSATSHPDYVAPQSVLNQLRAHADRGNVLINLPGSVWLSAYLFYYNPLAITKYIGIGKYPPGHCSIIRQSRANIPNDINLPGVTISSQSGRGVIYENINTHWNCKAHLCYVKKRQWKWCCKFVTKYPNADNVIAYAESQRGKPYCTGTDFITAKSRTTCFICSTITWRSFDRQGYNIHRLLARWMPTIAPADILLSDHVVQKHKIN